jgi:hypothetical protein
MNLYKQSAERDSADSQQISTSADAVFKPYVQTQSYLTVRVATILNPVRSLANTSVKHDPSLYCMILSDARNQLAVALKFDDLVPNPG